MSYETASSSSSRSIPPPVLPPCLHLTSPEENNNTTNRPGGSKLTIRRFRRAFHNLVSPRWFGTVAPLERVAEAMAEDENAVCSGRPSNSLKPRSPGRPTSQPSTTSIVSQSTASRIFSQKHSPTALITPFPSLNVSDIPPRSPTNKSPFSAVLLAGEDGEREEDDPALALWHTEQLHRARLAKLTRHLGEEIPAEMVLSPALLSRGTSRFSVHSRRGGYHHKRRSLDPSAFVQEPSVTGFADGVLQRSKSLKGQGDMHPTLSMTGTTTKTPSTEYVANGVRSPEITTNMIANPAPSTSTHSNLPVNIISNGVVPRERASVDAYSDRLLSRSSRSSAEISSETSPFYHHASRVPPKSRTLPRRPATADASRRVEKLANFFGVDYENTSAVAQALGTAQKLQFSSTSARGDLAIGIHAPDSQLEVDVKVSKPARFWNGSETTKSVHPDDVMDELRMMRAS